MRRTRSDLSAGPQFMEWLLHDCLLELDQPEPGCLVCYFSRGRWQHVGVMIREDRVLSKWGSMPLYEHGLSEVSDEYGDFVRFFARPTAAKALEYFIRFTDETGLARQ
jgi:hypothetical protein